MSYEINDVKTGINHAKGMNYHVHDIRAEMKKLEEEGEIKIGHIIGQYKEEEVMYGIKKKVPLDMHYQHKSCGQCANLPGVPRSNFYYRDKLGIKYYNDMQQTSCTAWNYHASGLGNLVQLASVAARNWHRAYEEGYNFTIHCVTSFGNYLEMRHLLVSNKELRDSVKKVLAKLGRELVIPEEIVHDSEIAYALRDKILAAADPERIEGIKGLRAVEHYGCHFFKQVSDDIIGGKRPIVVGGLASHLGVQMEEYSKWFMCCGFGFRHILVNREFTRSAQNIKLKAIKQEVDPDMILVNCTGCGTTFDKTQWIQKAVGEDYHYPVVFYSQLAALALGAHPFKEAGLNFHVTPVEPLLDKMGIAYN